MQYTNKFFEWLAGLIDGDGYFSLSQKNYGSLEIIMDSRDLYCLNIVKNRYGGSIKLRSGTKSFRYRLHHKFGLILLLNDLKGLLRNSKKILQYISLCIRYKIVYENPKKLYFESGWMAGFFDADGTITINKSNYQLSISISQKTAELINPLIILYGGNIYPDRASNTFVWYVTKRETILFLKDNYFLKNYLFSKKKNRIFLINEYFSIMELKNTDNILFNKLLNKFFIKWDNYGLEDKDMYHE